MAIRVYKRTTPGRRNASVNLHSEVTKKKPQKSLLRSKSKKGGRTHHGVITSMHRGGGHKQRYRLIDFARKKDFLRITLLTDEISAESQRFFQKLGFEHSHMIPMRLSLD